MIGMTNAPFSVGKSYDLFAATSWTNLKAKTTTLDTAIGFILTSDEVNNFNPSNVSIRSKLPETDSEKQDGHIVLIAGYFGGFSDQTIKLFTNKDLYANIVAAYIYRSSSSKFVSVDFGINFNGTWSAGRKLIYYSSNAYDGSLTLSGSNGSLTNYHSIYAPYGLGSSVPCYKEAVVKAGKNIAVYSNTISFVNDGHYSKAYMMYKKTDSNAVFGVFGLSSNTTTGAITSSTDGDITGTCGYLSGNYKYISNLSTSLTTISVPLNISTSTATDYRLKFTLTSKSAKSSTDIYGIWLK